MQPHDAGHNRFSDTTTALHEKSSHVRTYASTVKL